ncbi:hypothetical protein [Methanosarcina sp. MSH10X1]|nr:hypothetical protein [Methanosarcina sp. MSH10X1]
MPSTGGTPFGQNSFAVGMKLTALPAGFAVASLSSTYYRPHGAGMEPV